MVGLELVSRMRRFFLSVFLGSLLLPVVASRPALADIITELTLDFAPPHDSPFSGGTLSGAVQLWTSSDANIVPLGAETQLPDIGANHQAVLNWDTGETAACWISIGGLVLVNATEFQMFAFSSDPTTWEAPGAGEPAPLVDVGMLNGAAFEEASGALVGFDGPQQIGTWKLTETAVPEPSTLLMTLTVLGLVAIIGARQQKLMRSA